MQAGSKISVSLREFAPRSELSEDCLRDEGWVFVNDSTGLRGVRRLS